MGKKIDLTSRRFGRWLVLRDAGRDKNLNIRWLCRCDCGTEKEVMGQHLRGGRSTSCGCFHYGSMIRHGLSAHRLYSTWVNMIHRCSNPDSKDYPRYGARGITVCQRWADEKTGLQNFIADMDATHEPGMSLDRRDNALGYSPENCAWATAVEQNRNRRSNRLITHEGLTLSVAAWSERTGVSEDALKHRLDRGWPVQRALTQPVQQQRRAADHV
ncbi:hypothetical protein [Streptomyces ossamyceticus]|uniref:hypothetical protein n=1 Tax=Streptomyces ossamyceticus TaxID=249581 RepID=UPI0006E1CD42|nr:hypothetical protein [Streptomyces ossamyceticus]